MIKSSTDNYHKSSVECLVIGFCLYIAMTFHNKLTKAKIANKLMSVQSRNILCLNFSTKSCLISWPACLVKALDATDFSCAVSGFGQSLEMKYFGHRCRKLAARNSNGYRPRL